MPFTIRTSALTIQYFYEEGVTTSFTESNLIFLDESNQVKWRYVQERASVAEERGEGRGGSGERREW